jgi:hypothetical protein
VRTQLRPVFLTDFRAYVPSSRLRNGGIGWVGAYAQVGAYVRVGTYAQVGAYASFKILPSESFDPIAWGPFLT